jgi:hypothetical protein
MNIIVRDRAVAAVRPGADGETTARLATLADLKMQANPSWHPRHARVFQGRRLCLLSYATLRLYAGAHAGRPELIRPGFRADTRTIRGADVEFRGLGLQPYRHHQLLNSGLWQDKRGLLGYVFQTNFASRKGQTKSGYRKIGSIWLLGSRRRFITWFSPALRRLDIRRLP